MPREVISSGHCAVQSFMVLVKWRFYIIFFYVIFLFAGSGTALAGDKITMAFGGDPEREPQYQFYKLIYTEALEQLGYTFDYRVCPSKRCSILANSGKVDGEPQRIRSYGERYQNMVLVDEPIFINRTIGLSKDEVFKEKGLLSLRGGGYRVDYLRGSVWSSERLKPLVEPELLFPVANAEQGLKRLRLNRTDVFVDLEANVVKVLQQPEFKAYDDFFVVVVGANQSFPFLHFSRASLAPLLADELRSMKRTGRYDELLYQTIPELKEFNY